MMNNFECCGFLFPYIRLLNASGTGGALDFYTGNTLTATGIKFGSFTEYMKAGTGPRVYKITRSGNKDDIISKITVNQNVGEVVTLAVTDIEGSPSFMIIDEPCAKQTQDYAHMRVCNLSPDSDGINVYANSNIVLGSLNHRETSRYIEFIPGSYNLSLYKGDKKILNCGNQTLRQAKYNTLYIIGSESGKTPLSSVFSIDAGSYSGFYL